MIDLIYCHLYRPAIEVALLLMVVVKSAILSGGKGKVGDGVEEMVLTCGGEGYACYMGGVRKVPSFPRAKISSTPRSPSSSTLLA